MPDHQVVIAVQLRQREVDVGLSVDRCAGHGLAATENRLCVGLAIGHGDAAGLQFYVDWLQQGIRTRQTMALDILFGADGDDVEVLAQKRRVASAYLGFVENNPGYYADENELAELLAGVDSLASANSACLALQ